MPPVVGLLKLTAVADAPLQTVWLLIALTVAVGLTVMVKVVGVPIQPLMVAVTVIIAVTGLLPEFVVIYDSIFPIPLVPKPTLVELVQLNVTVPGVGLLKVISPTGELLHKVELLTVFTSGIGGAVIVTVPVDAVQFLASVTE